MSFYQIESYFVKELKVDYIVHYEISKIKKKYLLINEIRQILSMTIFDNVLD